MPAFSNTQQVHLLLQSLLFGAGVGLLYDVLRALRRQGNFGWTATAVCDAGFWLVLLTALFEFNLLFAAGQSRFFVLAGIAGGMLLYFSLISPCALPLFMAGWRVLAYAARLPGRIWRALQQYAQALGLADKCGSFAKKFVKPSSIFGRKGIK